MPILVIILSLHIPASRIDRHHISWAGTPACWSIWLYQKKIVYSVKGRMSIPAQVITCAGDALDFSIMVYAAMT
jgi:hypothetical protein